METDKSALQKRLLATFKVEAEEHLKALSSGLIEFEKSPEPEPRAKLIESLFREAHTLKGAARTVGLLDIEALARALEGVFGAIQRGDLAISPGLFDSLLCAVDRLADPALGGEAPMNAAAKTSLREMIRELEETVQGKARPAETPPEGAPPVEAKPVASSPPARPSGGEEPMVKGPIRDDEAIERAAKPAGVPPEEPPAAEETVKLSAAKLGALLRQSEQLLSAKLAAEHQAAEATALCRDIRQWRRTHEKGRARLGLRRPLGRRAPDSAAQAVPLCEFFEATSQRIAEFEDRLETVRKSAEQHDRALSGLVNELLEDLKRILMLPFSSLFEMLPKMVRDLCRDQGKEAELVIKGGDIQMDKRILDEIRAPLIHLIRNAMDHGIETPAERLRKGKPARGKVRLAVSQKETDKVEFVVADDGAGIDPARIRLAAQKRGLISAKEAERMSRGEILSLMFRSGLTTSPTVTDLSGRGLGLPIVQEKVAKVNGGVSFETAIDRGTTFRLTLPLTLATFRGVMTRLGESLFVIPTDQVDRVLRLDRAAIRTIEHRETICVESQVLALVRLQAILGIAEPARGREAPGKVSVVVVGSGDQRMAFAVDEVVGEQETLMKLIGKPLSRVRNVAGAMVSGMGDLVPILNVRDLIASARRLGGAPPIAAPVEAAPGEIELRSLLVVEDSITTRMLLKNVLEAAGYEVKTAVDGVDALMQLRMGEFDLVVSDVTMPRMDGFELTARMRADRRLAETPVVLITARESHEDKTRGIEVGADAYVVKSSFDQSNLLEIIERLI